MADATSLVALREMQVNTGFGQASSVSLHTKPWGRGCSLPTTLGSRSTVKSHAQPKDYQGLTCWAVACCLALITSNLLCSQGLSTGGTCRRDWARGAMAISCSLDVRKKFSPGKMVHDLAQKWQQPQRSRNQPWLEPICPVFANSNKGDSSTRLAGSHSESARCGVCLHTCLYQCGYSPSEGRILPHVHRLQHGKVAHRRSSNTAAAPTTVSR